MYSIVSKSEEKAGPLEASLEPGQILEKKREANCEVKPSIRVRDGGYCVSYVELSIGFSRNTSETPGHKRSRVS